MMMVSPHSGNSTSKRPFRSYCLLFFCRWIGGGERDHEQQPEWGKDFHARKSVFVGTKSTNIENLAKVKAEQRITLKRM